jgi:hypothetical protein
MKRSEIIKVIKEAVYSCNADLLLEDEEANMILTKLEQAGMKPKGYNGIMVTGEKYNIDNWEHRGRDVIYFNNWEPESELVKELEK